jgi:hypothetical protein
MYIYITPSLCCLHLHFTSSEKRFFYENIPQHEEIQRENMNTYRSLFILNMNISLQVENIHFTKMNLEK